MYKVVLDLANCAYSTPNVYPSDETHKFRVQIMF